MTKYTVWVGGSEISGYFLNKANADATADTWKDKGYDDVVVEAIND